MNERRIGNVRAAIDVLLEEVETEIGLIDKAGALAFERHDHDRARVALQRVDQVTAFRDRVLGIRQEWVACEPADDGERVHDAPDEQRPSLGRLQRGLRTQEEVYYRPILQALAELGGSARMVDVVERVERLMQGVFRDVDYEALASDSDVPRWRNAAQWARHAMVREGPLKPDSPRGVWELTDAGRRVLSGEPSGRKDRAA